MAFFVGGIVFILGGAAMVVFRRGLYRLYARLPLPPETSRNSVRTWVITGVIVLLIGVGWVVIAVLYPNG